MPNSMSKSDAARIQSSQDKGGHDVGKGSFPARAQSAGDRNDNAGIGQQQGSGHQGHNGNGSATSKK